MIIVLLIAGLVVGFAAGLFGIGGGIIMVPVLFWLFGINDVSDEVRLPLAIGTSLAVIVVTAARSLQAHQKSGLVDWQLLRSWLPWIGLGAIGSGFVAQRIPTKSLALIFAAGALYVGFSRLRKTPNTSSEKDQGLRQQAAWVERADWFLGIATGFISSLMGLGGGAAGVLIMGWTGRSMHKAVATASGFGLGVAIPGVLGFILAGQGQPALASPVFGVFSGAAENFGFVNVPGFLALSVMTMTSAPLGAGVAHRLSGPLLSKCFGGYIIVMAIFMVREAFM